MAVHGPRSSTHTRPRRRHALTPWLLAAACLLAGLGASTGLVIHGTLAAYAVPTSNPGNAVTAGTVALTDDDSGTAAFTVANLKPGDTGSRCVTVSYGGTLPAATTVYATTSSGTLAPYVDLDVQEGTSSTGFASCSGFQPSSLAFAGTLSSFVATATSYATGLGSFAPPGTGQTRTYKVTYAVQADAPDSSQGTTAGFDLRWEARNVDHVAAQGFGANGFGQIGDGTTTQRTAPVDVGTQTAWAQIASSCAIRADRTLWCWGSNFSGQLGQGNTTASSSILQVGAATDWTSVSVGGNSFVCGTRANGTLWCWGANSNYQLGLNDVTNRSTPTQVGVATTWKTVAAGGNHGCATRTDGTLWCWGFNTAGQVGIGSTTTAPVPAPVGAATSWATISAADVGTCATRTTGTAWCWGANAFGQVGDGTTTQRNSPTQVGIETNWVNVSTGGATAASSAHACGIQRTGTLWCWGRNANGELGQGDVVDRASPTQVGASTSWASVAAGGAHTCAIRTTHTTWCWGLNAQGQLGIGSTAQQTSPAQVAGSSRQLSASYNNTARLLWPGP